MMVRIEINEIENRKQRESVEPKVSFIKKKKFTKSSNLHINFRLRKDTSRINNIEIKA